MTHYLAFTIGPIEYTLKQARKTRELWAASYTISALMRELLAVLDGELLSPTIDKPEKNGAGIYPDRCYLKMNDATPAATVKAKIREAFGELAKKEKTNLPDVSRFFRVFAAEISEAELEAGQSPIMALNHILDGLELQALVPEGEEKLVPILEQNIQDLYKDGGRNDVFILYDDRKQRLPSLLELATSELNLGDRAGKYFNILTEPTNKAIIEYQRRGKNTKKERKEAEKHEADAQERALLQLKSAFGKDVKFRHKYVCFVLADGDAVGKTIGAIGNKDDAIREFSRKLGQFAGEAVKVTEAYGAIPVYAGGDDLLFIAPVQNAEEQHIFDLLNSLDDIFQKIDLGEIGRNANPPFHITPTLSFGISVSYYKYPMSESLDAMRDLLYNHAKSFTGKNAAAFRVLKHSGQAFGATLGKGGKAFSNFSGLLKACGGQETAFLTSVMHKLTGLKPFLEDALQNGNAEWFFKHHFNEQDHARSAADKYLKAVRAFCETAWEEEIARKKTEKEEVEKRGDPIEQREKIKPDIQTVANQIYAALRFVQFLNQEDHE